MCGWAHTVSVASERICGGEGGRSGGLVSQARGREGLEGMAVDARGVSIAVSVGLLFQHTLSSSDRSPSRCEIRGCPSAIRLDLERRNDQQLKYKQNLMVSIAQGVIFRKPFRKVELLACRLFCR